ncbi:YidB family protein [Streptomyces sp. NBC_00878]|uniref:YidB family protein n=1 Tax=Streptomyces sp. NBC_00878 TaxID=2975854 RepID=UPI0022541CEC|nr:YidB family protein [Streptomyces sp. NBC_00878]MCX4904336.1 YidB family protein [Streptomyces sp. NBC_00878]
MTENLSTPVGQDNEVESGKLDGYYCVAVLPEPGVTATSEEAFDRAESQGLMIPLAQVYQAKSWVSTGANTPLLRQDVVNGIGRDNLEALAEVSGISVDEVVAEAIEKLPALVDGASPEGTLIVDSENPPTVDLGIGKIVLAKISE